MKGGRRQSARRPVGGFVTLEGEEHYRISGYDLMPPFLMNIPSHTDLWLFVSSAGGLTAGRVNPDGSLFPYETEDRLHDAHHHTGPITLIRVHGAARDCVPWRPFLDELADASGVERTLYKNVIGNRLVFEEARGDLGLAFRYRWSASDDLGLVRTATLSNIGARKRTVSILDGLRNVLPYGAPLALYQQSSSLVDAYKRTDLDAETKLAVYSLTAGIIDRAEASEVLRANVVWCSAPTTFEVFLSLGALSDFRRGSRCISRTSRRRSPACASWRAKAGCPPTASKPCSTTWPGTARSNTPRGKERDISGRCRSSSACSNINWLASRRSFSMTPES